MATTTKTLKVFIASPGGLPKERRAFRDILEEFNRSDALSRGLHFIPVGWEDTLETEGRPLAISAHLSTDDLNRIGEIELRFSDAFENAASVAPIRWSRVPRKWLKLR